MIKSKMCSQKTGFAFKLKRCNKSLSREITFYDLSIGQRALVSTACLSPCVPGKTLLPLKPRSAFRHPELPMSLPMSQTSLSLSILQPLLYVGHWLSPVCGVSMCTHVIKLVIFYFQSVSY